MSSHSDLQTLKYSHFSKYVIRCLSTELEIQRQGDNIPKLISICFHFKCWTYRVDILIHLHFSSFFWVFNLPSFNMLGYRKTINGFKYSCFSDRRSDTVEDMLNRDDTSELSNGSNVLRCASTCFLIHVFFP